MPLDEAGWEALRAEHNTTPTSVRALAQKYGVDESTIRDRRKRKPDDWKRDPRVAEAVQQEGHFKTLEGAIRTRVMGAVPHTPPHPRDRARDAGDAAEAVVEVVRDLVADARAALEETAADAHSTLIAQANLDHLGRTARLKQIFEQQARLLGAALRLPEVPTGTDGPGQISLDADQAAALAILVGQSRSDTLASHITAAVAMAEKIQMQERRALGMDQGPRKLELSGPNGGPIQSAGTNAVAFDPGSMTTDQLAKIYEAGILLSGAQGRPPIPLPPGDPGEATEMADDGPVPPG